MAVLISPWPVRSVYFDAAVAAWTQGSDVIADYSDAHPDRAIFVVAAGRHARWGPNVSTCPGVPAAGTDLVVTATLDGADGYRRSGLFAVAIGSEDMPDSSARALSAHDLIDDILPVAEVRVTGE